jgi:hypothetical protein
MSVRGLEARIVKLETRRRHDGEFYLMWRQPGTDVEDAVAAVSLPQGSKVICAEWFAKAPAPPSRWVSADARVPAQQEDYLDRTIWRYMARRGIKKEDLRKGRCEPDPVASQMTDLQLYDAILGMTAQ